MVFLIQNMQNRDSKEVHLKLDEILRTNHGRNSFLDLDDLSDGELADLDQEFHTLSEQQVTSPVMKKLHAKLRAEHRRRRG
jgi:low affinity Fe/Cu permease